MKHCDICGREIEQGMRHHAACLRRLFGISELPQVELSLEEVAVQAQVMAGKMSISGVQPKLSIVRKGRALVPVEKHGQFILKPQTGTFSHLPENENLCMCIAGRLEIQVPAHGLVNLRDGSFAYVVRRFDRAANGDRLRCEDFAQILGQDKYSGSTEQIGRRLKEISSAPGLDAQLFFERILFSFLLGNGDAHLKNFSVVETDDGTMRLTPAYDVACSKLVIKDEKDSALTINGKQDHLRRKDFVTLSDYLDIPAKARDGIFARFRQNQPVAADLIADSYLPGEDRKRMAEIVFERYQRIYGA